ncbi:E3 ubiquitin ligase [Dimargaris xerosporica]|nr:E3 ubiquitin ligase [Dimargaris xerosporica]
MASTALPPATLVGLGGPHPFRVLRAHLNTLYLLRHQIRQASELRKKLISLRKSFTDTTTCAICTELLSEPHTLECGHSFCQDCLQTWFETKKECPTCREQIFRRPTPAFSLAHQTELVSALNVLGLPPDEDDLMPDLDRLFGDVAQTRHLEQLVVRGTMYRSDCKRVHTAIKAKARAYLLTTGSGAQRSAPAAPTGSTSSSRAAQSGTRHGGGRQWNRFFPSRVSRAVLRNRTLLVVCGQCSTVMDRPTCQHCPSQPQPSPPTSDPEPTRPAELPRLPAYYLPTPAPVPLTGTDGASRSAATRTRTTTGSTRPLAQGNRQQTQPMPTTTTNNSDNIPTAISIPYFHLEWGGPGDDEESESGYSNPEATPIPLYSPPLPTGRAQPPPTDNSTAQPAATADQGSNTRSTARSIYHAIDPDWDFDAIANDLGDMNEEELADLEEYIFYSDPRHAMYRYDPSQFEDYDEDDRDSLDDELGFPYE